MKKLPILLLVLLFTAPAWAANEVLLKTGTVICLADVTDHAPAAANNICTRTHQIDLTSVANAAYQQSAKFDFGATRAARYNIQAALEFAVAPTDASAVNLYISPSSSATASTANPGGVSGSDGAYTGYSSNAASAVRQLQFIGACVLTVQATTNIQQVECGTFTPLERYGSLVFHNASGQAMVADAVEMSIRLAPIVDEIQ